MTPNILALVTDAFGGHGGIALYMRDVLRCVASMDVKPNVRLVARKGQRDGVTLPTNIDWDTSALRGKGAFMRSVLLGSGRKAEPDLVLCGHINLLPSARLAAMRCNAPLVLFIYGIDAWNPPKGFIARKLSGSPDHTISISDITRQRFLSWCSADAGKVSLLPNAIRQERYGTGPKNPELLARYGIEGKRVLMTLGRLAGVQRHKGVDEIIAVLPRLLDDFPDLVYLVAGGGDDIPRLQKKAEHYGVGGRVIFTGLVDENEKADHYRLADAFALTGHGDGFGFVLLEAMACGIPVVASVLDGSQEAVLNGDLGVLVDPENPESLIEGISEALQQPKRIPEGLDYFSYDNFCRKLRNTLQPIMSSPG